MALQESAATLPQPGQIARVRQRLYLVEATVPAGIHDTCSLVRLACLDDDAQGQPLEVLWEREPGATIVEGERWQNLAARGFDPVEAFAAYYHVLRWNCVTSADPRLLQSPFRAGIRLDPYQLEPLRKALQLPRVNLFIADDVGLGKTVEAGLILRELLLRKRVHQVVIACPPTMLDQWREEMDQRFGLDFAILDRAYVQRMRQERGFGVNPWSTHPRFLVSHRLLVEEAYAGTLRAMLGGLRPASLLILDEAHHAAPASGQRYAIDSHFTRAIDDLAPRFEHRLFLSATPHNGHSNSFARLLQMLDRQRFWPGMKVAQKDLAPVMVRRLKEDLRAVEGGFPRREVEALRIEHLPPETPELKLSELLDAYRELRRQHLASESKRTQAASGLLMCGLQKRLLSSVEAFARTLQVHIRGLEKQGVISPRDLERLRRGLFAAGQNPDDPDNERAELSAEDLDREADEELLQLSAAAGGSGDRERALLAEMSQLAESGRGRADARVQRLAHWIREKCQPADRPGTWNHRRVLIFTEFEDTLRYLLRQLLAELDLGDDPQGRIEIFQGRTSRDERERIKAAFNADPTRHPVRILLATDAAREGINLQAHCWDLFHFDLPWNPSRLEQRNGRIDRKLQPSPEVYCRYFLYPQREEDRVLQALVQKTHTIRLELGSAADVLGARVEKLLEYGIRRAEVAKLAADIESARLAPERQDAIAEELEAARERQDDLRSQVSRVRVLLGDAQKALGFRRERLETAVTAGLRLLGAPGLQPALPPEEAPECAAYMFPRLDEQAGADPSWAETLDSLRPPRGRGEEWTQWRRRPPRPVVFHDPGVVTEEVVQLHLEQRVVQRLLSRFTAQGFVFHDLSRACLARAADSLPRVVLLGRLALYGRGAARLHEELVRVAARWVEPEIRKGALTPYKREAETETLRDLEEGLASNAPPRLGEPRLRALQASAPRDVAELLPHLEAAGRDLAEKAQARLAERAQREGDELIKLLEGQKEAIENRERTFEPYALQLRFGGMELPERRQLESDRSGWRKRLAEIPGEIESGPRRIREGYEVVLTRIEPVGLVYLWPDQG